MAKKKFLRSINFKSKLESSDQLCVKDKVIDVHKLHIYDLNKFTLKSKACWLLEYFAKVFVEKANNLKIRSNDQILLYLKPVKTKFARKSLKNRVLTSF